MAIKAKLVLLLCWIALVPLGCERHDSDQQPSLDLPVNLASAHAESQGALRGRAVESWATEMILLHPSSTRQQLSRENLLLMDVLKERLPARNPPPELLE